MTWRLLKEVLRSKQRCFYIGITFFIISVWFAYLGWMATRGPYMFIMSNDGSATVTTAQQVEKCRIMISRGYSDFYMDYIYALRAYSRQKRIRLLYSLAAFASFTMGIHLVFGKVPFISLWFNPRQEATKGNKVT